MLDIRKRRFFINPTVGEIKKILMDIPDNYNFSICGDSQFYLHVDTDPINNDGCISFDHSGLDDIYDADSVWLPIWKVDFTKDNLMYTAIVRAETGMDACDIVVKENNISYSDIHDVIDNKYSVNSAVPKILGIININAD